VTVSFIEIRHLRAPVAASADFFFLLIRYPGGVDCKPRVVCRRHRWQLSPRARNRDEAIVAAYATGEFSYQRIATFFGLHFTAVGRIVRATRKRKNNGLQ
jgi:hypothetical protein